MSAPYPDALPEAFALNADPTHRNTIPATTLNPQRASYSLGFPPQTMTPIIAGGKPMLGPDMNGVLYAISSHTYYQQTGQPYRWNADVLVAIGGYAIGTLLGSADGLTLWYNTVANNTNDPDPTANNGWVPVFSYGTTTIPTTGGVVTLTTQARKSVIILSGALVANLQVVLPNDVRRWLIVNTTSGPFSTTVRTALGLGVNIPQGGFNGPTEVWGDGTNIYPVVAPITLPTDVAPTPNTIVLRSNTGYVFATYLNQNSNSAENPPVGSVFVENMAGDGFLRKATLNYFLSVCALQSIGGQIQNGQIVSSAVTQFTPQILANAALTGAPTAPTPPAGDNSTRIATTAFVAGNVSRGNPGFERFPNGSIRQFGSHVFGDLFAGFGTNFTDVVFATPFPNGITSITFGKTGQCSLAMVSGQNFTLNGFRLVMEEAASVVQGPDNTATWEIWGW